MSATMSTTTIGTQDGGRWIAHHTPRPAARLRLFCFAYAGGSASLYRGWQQALPETVELFPIQLPGRATRFNESPFTCLEPLIERLLAVLLPYLLPPFAFFGHSMGALLGFELARTLRRQGGPTPTQLFVSGRHAPQRPDPVRLAHLTDRAFVDQLRRYRGTPRDILDSDELMALFMPLLRADFTLCEGYRYRLEPPLDCPITAFGGAQDDTVLPDALIAWREQSAAPFRYYLFPGDHFFIHSDRPALLRTLDRELEGLVRSLATQPDVLQGAAP